MYECCFAASWPRSCFAKMGRSLALSVPDIQYPGAGTPKLNKLSGLLQLSCKQPSLLGGHGGASLYLKVKELSLFIVQWLIFMVPCPRMTSAMYCFPFFSHKESKQQSSPLGKHFIF